MVQFSCVSRVVLTVLFLSVVSISAYGQDLKPQKGSNGKWGFIDKSGTEVIPFKYDIIISTFDDGFAVVKLNGKRGFIDKKDNFYDNALSFCEGLAAVKLNGKWGFIDKSSTEVIPFKYDKIITSFYGGLASVKFNGKRGYIDKKGNFYDNALSFCEGLAAVKLNGKWGFIDKSGTEVIPFKYDKILSSFDDGLALVQLNSERGFIDKNGTFYTGRNKTQALSQSRKVEQGAQIERVLVSAKAEAERVAEARNEAERIAITKAEVEREEEARKETERIAAAKAEEERVEAARKELERIAAAKAEAERIETARKEAERIAAINPIIPKVSIINPINRSTVESEQVKIVYDVSETIPTSIRISIDGRPVQLITDAKLGENTVMVDVPDKDFNITIVAQNQFGASVPAAVSLIRRIHVFKPSLYILAIGISDYDDPELRLRFAAKDASDFTQALVKQGGQMYNRVRTNTLFDGSATAENIRDGLSWLQTETTSRDIAMIYIAGHGVNDNFGDFFFMPVNADKNRINATCVSYTDIKRTTLAVAGKMIVFIDACHSGNVLGNTQQRAAGINQAVSELTGAENGAVVFTSSTGRQFSLEDPEWNNGAFTKALVEGLTGKADLIGNKMGGVIFWLK